MCCHPGRVLIDDVQNKAMKIERLRSRAPPSGSPLSIEESSGDDRVPLSFMMTGQPIAQPLAKSSTSTPTITPAITKSKDNPYTKSGVGKCYKCGEPGYTSNECPKRR